MSQEADIIVVGAGAAGCVIAARLAAADPNLRILVLESGPDTFNDPAVTTPARFLENLDPSIAPRTRFVKSITSEHLSNRETVVEVGRCVGGGTAINFMAYARPVVSDLNRWESKHSNPGWGYESMLPLFKKFETFEPLNDAPTHGYEGPIHVIAAKPSPVGQQWLDVMNAYDKKSSVAHDLNDFSLSNGYAEWPRIVSRDGVRQDAAHCFLYPALHKPNSNITLKTGCTVDRVIFDGDVAVGVEYRDEADQNASARVVAKAKKYVVLSAGGLGSSVLLERSGIGSPAVLSAAGVQVKVALEGVGENYQDHVLVGAAYNSAPGVSDDRDAYLRGDPEVLASAKAKYESGSGPCATSALDAGARVRPQTRDEAKAVGLSDAFLENWSFWEESQDRPVFLLWFIAGGLFPRGLPSGDYYTIVSLTSYPFSRGSVHIRSANVDEPPVFDPGYLTHPADVSTLMWQYKWARERARRLPAYRGELIMAHPNFSKDSQAACSASQSGPVPIDAPDIVYSEEDNKVLESWVRQTVQTSRHPLGTCAMKPRHLGGVIDSELNVYGVKGLKIADTSIPPENVCSNTMSIALAIGEKAAVIIAKELGITL